MWKIILGFVVFALVAIFALKKAGGNIDLGGEKHSVEVPAAAEPASAASK